MAKTLVLYYSKYGSTKKYAEWIVNELIGDICPIDDVKEDTLARYEVIIIGSSLYAGSIRGMDIIVKNYKAIEGRKLVLFTCGLADYSKSENINAITKRIDAAIPENIRKNIKVFLLRGGIDYKRLSFIHKIMMAIMNKITVAKAKKEGDNASEETKEFIESYGKTLDFTDRNSIKGIVEYCKG